MAKIPVGATIAHAYRFAFGNFVNLVRVSWLPQISIAALLLFAVLPAFRAILQATLAKDVAAMGGAFLELLPAYVVLLLLFFVQITAVAQAELGLSAQQGWLVFPVGKPMWRLVAGFLVFLVIVVGIMLVVGAALGFAAAMAGIGAGSTAPGTGAMMITIVLPVCVYGMMIFLFVRLGFLLTPAAVALPSIGIGPAWRLSRGNFWRLFVVTVGLLLPFIVLEMIAILLLLPRMPTPQPGADATQQAILAWEADLFTGMQNHLILALPVMALFTLLLYGVLVSAQCFAYRAATVEDAA
jgi:hypothetical protein